MAEYGVRWQGEFADPRKSPNFRTTQNGQISGPRKMGYFRNHQKTADFQDHQKRGLFLGPEKGRFLGPVNKACF